MEPDVVEAMLKRYEPPVPSSGFKDELLERTLATDHNRRILRWKIGAAIAAIALCIGLNVHSDMRLASLSISGPRQTAPRQETISVFSLHLANSPMLLSMVGS